MKKFLRATALLCFGIVVGGALLPMAMYLDTEPGVNLHATQCVGNLVVDCQFVAPAGFEEEVAEYQRGQAARAAEKKPCRASWNQNLIVPCFMAQ